MFESPLLEKWQAAWPQALETWSRFTRLRAPIFCLSHAEAEREGLTGSFAMIRLQDQAIVVNLAEVKRCKVEDYAVEVLAHEIGHHVYAPATLTDHGRTLARMRWALPTIEQHAPMVANLYTDLLINDRLQRSANLRMAQVYQVIGDEDKPAGKVWALYTRIYEILWRLDKGALHGGTIDDAMEGDAWLGSRLIRSFARDWLGGAGRFAALLLPYLLEDQNSKSRLEKWFDTRQAGAGGNPSGLISEEMDERSGAIHPSQDPNLTGEENETVAPKTPASSPADALAHAPARGQCREPFQYGELLRSLGLNLTDHEIAVRYYRERALPHIVRFPSRPVPEQLDALPEGLEPWEIGSALDEIDWLQSVMQSPRVVPGMTTVQRVWGNSPGSEPATKPIDLDLYVDSSGSMPHPQHVTSFLTLAGAIMALSALRAGARVQVTLWSGKNQFLCTQGFTRDENDILRALTGFFGGATAFPLHVMRDTYAARRPDANPAHVLVISDDGVTTMFDRDEKGNSGWDVAAQALARAGAGGTFVLNIYKQWKTANVSSKVYADLRRAEKAGWSIFSVSTWNELETFARDFSHRTYGDLRSRKAVTS
jgi:hypothetical protein